MGKNIAEINQALLELKQHALPFVAEKQCMSLQNQQAKIKEETIEALMNSAWFCTEWLEEWMEQKVFSLGVLIKKTPKLAELIKIDQIPTDAGNSITEDALDKFFEQWQKPRAQVKQDREQISKNLIALNQKTNKLIQQINLYISQFKAEDGFYENLVCTQDIEKKCQYKRSKALAVKQIVLLSQLAKTLLHELEQKTKLKLPVHYSSFRNRMQKIQEYLSSIAKKQEYQQSSASSSTHTPSPLVAMNLKILMDFNQTQIELREACGDEIEKLKQLIQTSLCGIEHRDFTDINTLNLWLENLTGCQSQPWDWDIINQQCQRLQLYRMLQTDPNGKLDTSDQPTDFLQRQDYSATEDVFIKLLTTIIDSHGQDSLTLNENDLLILKSLNSRYWQHEDSLGCHAIHMLANCGESGTNNVVLNHCVLLQRIINEYPRLCDLESISIPHPQWNLLNFILFHFMRVTATPTYNETPVEEAYPGLISLIMTIKKIRPRHYIKLLGQEDFTYLLGQEDCTYLLSDSPKHKERNSLVRQFFKYGGCRLHVNGESLDLVGSRSTPKSKSRALIPIKAFYEEIANELFCIDQHPKIRATIDSLQTVATNTIRSPTGKRRSSGFNQQATMQSLNDESGSGSSSTHNTTESKGIEGRQTLSVGRPLLRESQTQGKRVLTSTNDKIIKLINEIKRFQTELQANTFELDKYSFLDHSLFQTSCGGAGSLRMPFPTITIDPNYNAKEKFRQLERRASDILNPATFNPDDTFHESAYGRDYSALATTDNPESSENMQQKCSMLIQKLEQRLKNNNIQRPPKKRRLDRTFI